MRKAAGDHPGGQEALLALGHDGAAGGKLLPEQREPVQDILGLAVGEGQDLGLELVLQGGEIGHHIHSSDYHIIHTQNRGICCTFPCIQRISNLIKNKSPVHKP